MGSEQFSVRKTLAVAHEIPNKSVHVTSERGVQDGSLRMGATRAAFQGSRTTRGLSYF